MEIKTIYNIGDQVWFIKDRKVVSEKVACVVASEGNASMAYNMDGVSTDEGEVKEQYVTENTYGAIDVDDLFSSEAALKEYLFPTNEAVPVAPHRDNH